MALAAVLLIGIPLALLLDGFGPELEPADTITPFPVDGPVVLVADNGTILQGKDHPPGATVTVELNGPVIGDGVVGPSATVGTDGRFDLLLWPDLGLAEGDEATVVVTDLAGEALAFTVPYLPVSFDRLDPVEDLAVGRAAVPDGTPIQVRIESGTDLAVAETETFNGAWEIDLSGTVDVTLESVGTAWVPSGDGFSSTAPRAAIPGPTQLDLTMDNWFLQGNGWEPGAEADLVINGEVQPAPIAIGAGGRFEMFLEAYGLEPGDLLEVDDGTNRKAVTVHRLEVRFVDQVGGVIAGETDLPDGTIVSVGHDRGAGVEVAVQDGRFSASFQPGTIEFPDVGYVDADGDWLAGTVSAEVEASLSVSSPVEPRSSTADEGVVVLWDGSLEVRGFGLAPGDAVGVQVVDDEGVSFSASDAATVAADGTFELRFEGVVADGEARVAVGDGVYAIPATQVNLVRVFEATDQVGVEVQAPAGTSAIVRVSTAGSGTDIPVQTTGSTLLVDVPGLEGSSEVEFWIEAGDGWVMNRGQTGDPHIEYFADEALVSGTWFEPGEALTVTVDGEVLGTVTADELGRAGVFVDLAPGTTVALSNDRVAVDLGPVPSLTVDGVDGTTVSGTADLDDGTTLTWEAQDGALQDDGDVSVFGGSWSAEGTLGEGPLGEFLIRWSDEDGDQYVVRWTGE